MMMQLFRIVTAGFATSALALGLAGTAVANKPTSTAVASASPDTSSASPQARPTGPTAVATTAAPAPTPMPTTASPANDRASRVHLGIVTCEGAPFYSWPDRSSIPTGTAYPPARMGDAIHVIGDGSLAPGGDTLYETTIDVFTPFGVGKHFYISAYCINAG